MNTATLTFTLEHRGRGGTLTVSDGDDELVCPIDLVEGGAFAVHLGGRTRAGRLEAGQRSAVRTALRRWLDQTGRSDWSIDG